MREYQKWIVLPDLQLPYADYDTLRAVEAYMKDVAESDSPWDGWLQLGDFLDFNELSKYNEGYEASVEEDVWDTFESGNKLLERHRKIVGRKCKMVLLEGNHDFRVEDTALRFPKLRKILNYERNLRLKDHQVRWVRTWKDGKVFKLGNAYFLHGRYTNMYHAKKMVQAFGVCVYYGHTHDVMEIPVIQMGKDKTLVGKSLGCLCDYNQHYLRGNPTNWQQAFAVFYVFPDGYYTEQTVRIFKHRFVGPDNGKVYDGMKLRRKEK